MMTAAGLAVWQATRGVLCQMARRFSAAPYAYDGHFMVEAGGVEPPSEKVRNEENYVRFRFKVVGWPP